MLLVAAGACTSILDFDGYDYVEMAGAGGSTSADGGTSTSASGGSAPATSGTAGNGGAGGCQSYQDCPTLFCNNGVCEPCSSHVDCLDAPDTWCDSGTCVPKKMLGAPCNDDDEECLSDSCQNDVCCSNECAICQACDLPGNVGTCTNVPAGQDPNDDCPLACDGNGMCQ